MAQAQDERNHLRRQRAAFRASFNPVKDLSDTEFRNRYRLTKEAFEFLCQELANNTNLKSSQQINMQTKVCTYKSFSIFKYNYLL